MAVQLGGISVNFGANLGPLQSGISSAQGLIGGFGVAAAAAMVGFGVASVKAAGDFQSSLTSLSTGAGEAQSNLKMVGDGILNLSTATGTSTKQLVDGMYMIESAGYHGSAGLNVLKAAAEGAKVGNADLGVVADATTTIMTDFGLKSNQAGVAVNTLTATVASGKTTMEALSASLSQVLPTASAAKIGLNDTMAAMATMTGEGVPAAQAATYLRQTIIALENPGAKAASTLKSVGLTSAQVANEMKVSLPGTLQMITDALAKKFPVGSQAYIKAIADISGGSKQMQAMLDLTGTHMQTFKSNVDNISGAVKKGGDSINGWSQVQGNFNQQMAQLGAAVNVVEIKLGTMLLPVLTKIAEAITPLIMDFSTWFDKSNVLASGLDYLSRVLQIFVVPAFHATHMITKTVTDFFQNVADITSAVTKPSFAQLGETVNTTLNPAMSNLSMLFQLTAQQLPDLTGATTLQKQAFTLLDQVTGPLRQSLGNVNSASTLLGQVFGGALNNGIQIAINGMHSFADFVDGPVIRSQQALVDWLGRSSQAYGGLAQAAIAAMGKLATLKMPSLSSASTATINIGEKIIGNVSTIAPVIAGILSQSISLAANQIAGKIAAFFAPVTATLKNVLGPIFAPIVSLWQQAVAIFTPIWQAFSQPFSALGPVWKIFTDELKNVWQQLTQLFPIFHLTSLNAQDMANIIGKAIVGTIGFLLSAASGVLAGFATFLQGWHNLAIGIDQFFAGVKQIVASGWQIIVGTFTGNSNLVYQAWNGLLDGMRMTGEGELGILQGLWQMTFGAILSGVQTFATSMWTLFVNLFPTLQGPIVSGLQSLGGSIHSFFGGAWDNYIAGPLGSISHSIINWVTSLDSQALQWGKNLIQGFIDGINGMIGAVGQAASNVVGTVTNFLGFHSPAKMGPGADADKWAPNLVNMFSSGLVAGVPQVAKASAMLATPLQGVLGRNSAVASSVPEVKPPSFILPRGKKDATSFSSIGTIASVSGRAPSVGNIASLNERGPSLVTLPSTSAAPLQGNSGSSQDNGDQHIIINFDGNEMAHYIGKKQQKLMYLHTGVK